MEENKFDFTRAIKEIEDINQWFQSEEIDLDVGLTKIRYGFGLIKRCRDRLKSVENEFNEIKKEFSEEEKPEKTDNDSEMPF